MEEPRPLTFEMPEGSPTFMVKKHHDKRKTSTPRERLLEEQNLLAMLREAQTRAEVASEHLPIDLTSSDTRSSPEIISVQAVQQGERVTYSTATADTRNPPRPRRGSRVRFSPRPPTAE